MKKYYIMAVIIVLAFVALGASSLKSVVNHYVTEFPEVAKSGQSRIQVPGTVEKTKTIYDNKSGVLTFYMKDEKGREMKFVYSGTKPGNFDEAEKVVAVGHYGNGEFNAEQLLVKCPSKYQNGKK